MTCRIVLVNEGVLEELCLGENSITDFHRPLGADSSGLE